MKISAYIPCFNNAATLAEAVKSVREQTVPVSEFMVVDDGSTDHSPQIAQDLGARVIHQTVNFGRGAVRSRAVQEAAHSLILSCDATNALAPDFLERARPWFDDQKVAAVFGRMGQQDNSTMLQRWRARHLYKTDLPQAVNRRASLATWGVVLRKSHVLAAGNFNAKLRHSEDADLGERLLGAGYDVVFDPGLHVLSLSRNSLPELMERYWRWYAGKDEATSWKLYGKQIAYSVKVMALQDLRAGDMLAAPISLFCPHYQFWKSWVRQAGKARKFESA